MYAGAAGGEYDDPKSSSNVVETGSKLTEGAS